MVDAPARTTYVLVDGENIDATLGTNVLQRRPEPGERPRWERVREFAARHYDQPAKGLFFLNASSGQLPTTFVSALLALQWQPIPLSGPPSVKVVDEGILRTLAAIKGRPADVLLASHDADFAEAVADLLAAGHRVALLGFREFVSGSYTPLVAEGLRILDLEDEVGAFTSVLPRVRIIDLDSFDPTRFL